MPEDLLELVIKASSNVGDIILDPFGGTGTTAFVAKKLGRNFVTIELSQDYYNIILKRLDGSLADVKVSKKQESEEQKKLFYFFE